MTYCIMTIGKSILLVATLSLIGALAACGGSSHNSGGGTTTPTISLSTPPTSLAIGKFRPLPRPSPTTPAVPTGPPPVDRPRPTLAAPLAQRIPPAAPQ